MQRGDEYKNIYPVWDWHHLPGATCTAAERVLPPVTFGIGSEGTTRFVGGVTDGSVGLAAWILDRDGVHGHKACALLEDVLVAVGAGLSGPKDERLQTGVNQCWRFGAVWVKDALGVRLLSDGDARIASSGSGMTESATALRPASRSFFASARKTAAGRGS